MYLHICTAVTQVDSCISCRHWGNTFVGFMEQQIHIQIWVGCRTLSLGYVVDFLCNTT